MKFLLFAVVLCSVVLLPQIIAAQSSDVVNVTNCADQLCESGCQSQIFQQNQCLTVDGEDDLTVKLSCYTGNSMCVHATIYQDSQCKVHTGSVAVDTVCNSCQSNYTISCGALHNALFWAVNCTDNACQNCGGAIIVPFQKCTLVRPFGYVLVQGVYKCPAVQVTNFPSKDCSGTSWQFFYPSAHCVAGTIMQCQPASIADGETGSSVAMHPMLPRLR